jgi:predicted membrane channel-forming protein YqfA (hemolysin III family)
MANNTSQHILSASANLLGFCLFVITSLRISNRLESHFIDLLTSSVALLLTCSCVFSFISIRSSKEIRERRLELIADYLFITSLIGILVIILMIGLNFI